MYRAFPPQNQGILLGIACSTSAAVAATWKPSRSYSARAAAFDARTSSVALLAPAAPASAMTCRSRAVASPLPPGRRRHRQRVDVQLVEDHPADAERHDRAAVVPQRRRRGDVGVAQLPDQRVARPGIGERLGFERDDGVDVGVAGRASRRRSTRISALSRRLAAVARQLGVRPPDVQRHERRAAGRRGRARPRAIAADGAGEQRRRLRRRSRRAPSRARIDVAVADGAVADEPDARPRLRARPPTRRASRSGVERGGRFEHRAAVGVEAASRTLRRDARRPRSRSRPPAARACHASASNVETGVTVVPPRAPAPGSSRCRRAVP